MSDILLAPTTSAAQSTSFGVQHDTKKTVILHAASGLTAAEYGDIQISHDGGTTFQDLYSDGSQVRLTDTNNSVTVYGPGVFRVDKEVTTNAAGVYLSRKDNL